MPKTIVAKTEIQTDDCLAVVKSYRIMNKRAGEAKRGNNAEQYEFCVTKMRELAAKAETLGFHIWVEFQEDDRIVTGHTYSKDYKPTPETWNDYEEHLRKEVQRKQEVMALMARLLPAGAEPESHEPDYDEDSPENN